MIHKKQKYKKNTRGSRKRPRWPRGGCCCCFQEEVDVDREDVRGGAGGARAPPKYQNVLNRPFKIQLER